MSEQVIIEHHDVAAKFLDALRPSHLRWLPALESQHRWIFRGQGNADWGLVPAAWRDSVVEQAAFKLALADVDLPRQLTQELWRQGGDTADMPETLRRQRMHRVVAQRVFELTSVQAFAAFVDELGMPVPDGGQPNRYFWDYCGCATGASSCYFDEVHVPAAYALAQHHHVPTRLLDWTTNPLYAAYFAASHNAAQSSDRIAVWAVHRDAMLPVEWRRSATVSGQDALGTVPSGWRLLTYPRYQSAFMHAQSGVFTFYANAGHHYITNGKWPDMTSDDL